MRKQILLLVAALILPLSIYFFASNYDNRMITRVEQGPEANTMTIQLANLQNRMTEITIQDVDGQVWFKETVFRKKGFFKQYRIETMPANDYLVVVRQGAEHKLHAFYRVANRIEVFNPVGGENATRLVANFTPKEGPAVEVQLANLMDYPATVQLGTLYSPNLIRESTDFAKGYHKEWVLEGMNSNSYFFFVRAKHTLLLQEFELENGAVVLKGAQELNLEVPETEPAPVTEPVTS